MSDIADTRLNAIEDRFMENDEKRKQELTELIERLDNRKIDAKDKLDELEEQQTVHEAKITYAINHMHDIAKQWPDADYGLQHRNNRAWNRTNKSALQIRNHQKNLSEPEKSSQVIARGMLLCNHCVAYSMHASA